MTYYHIQYYTQDGRLWSWITQNKNGSDQTAAASGLNELPNAPDFRAVIVTPTYVH